MRFNLPIPSVASAFKGYFINLLRSCNKAPQTGGSPNRNNCLTDLEAWSWKSSFQQFILVRTVGEELYPRPSLCWLTDGCLHFYVAFTLGMCLCTRISSIYKDTSDIRVGSTLMNSFNLITSVKTLSPNK